MNLGIKKKICLSDLDFPLLNQLRGMSKSYFAKQKLLTGKQSLQISGNTCNSITLDNDKYYIDAPSYDAFNSSLRFSRREVACLFNTTNKVSLVSNCLYKLPNSNMYFLIKHNTIICMFKIISLVELTDLIFSETDEHYAIAFSSYSKRHRLVIDKKDLALRKG